MIIFVALRAKEVVGEGGDEKCTKAEKEHFSAAEESCF